MQERAAKVKMPCPPEEHMLLKFIGHVPVEDLKGLQVALAQMKQDRDAWECTFRVSNEER